VISRSVRHALVGAGVAAAVLTTGAVVRLAQDDELAACRAATAAVEQANSRHQDLLALKDREIRRRVRDVRAEVATLRVEQAKAELDAARAARTLACHYPDAEPDRT
jgi:hypothetical protein